MSLLICVSGRRLEGRNRGGGYVREHIGAQPLSDTPERNHRFRAVSFHRESQSPQKAPTHFSALARTKSFGQQRLFQRQGPRQLVQPTHHPPYAGAIRRRADPTGPFLFSATVSLGLQLQLPSARVSVPGCLASRVTTPFTLGAQIHTSRRDRNLGRSRLQSPDRAM